MLALKLIYVSSMGSWPLQANLVATELVYVQTT